MELTGAMKPCPFCGSRDQLFVEPDETGSGGQWVSPFHAGCSQVSGCGVSVSGDYIEEAVAAWNGRAGPLPESVRLAYGLLWHMQVDTRDPNLRLASDARRALLAAMSRDDQADGIARAKATDGRFTGAA